MNSNREKINKLVDETIQMCIDDIENCHRMMNSEFKIVRMCGKESLEFDKFEIKELIEIKNKYKIC